MDFNSMYSRLRPRLKWLARSFKGYNLFVQEDDLYQEISIYLWKTYKDGVPQTINDAYIVKGCQFHLLNYLRKNKTKASFVSLETPIDSEGATLQDLIPYVSECMHDYVDKSLTFSSFDESVFNEKEKKVVTLLRNGYTVREIGEQMGVSHVMVVKYKKKIIDKFRKVKRLPKLQ